MKPRATFAIIVAVILVLAAGSILYWNSNSNHKPQATQGLTTVTVAEVGELFVYMPLYYAQDRGFFAKNGLQVNLVSSGGDDKSVAAVIAGSADFGVGDPTFAAIADQQGQNVKVVASVVNGVPFWGVTKEARIGTITNPAQLRGLTVATFPKPSTAYTLQAQMFKDGGLTPSIRQAQFGSLLPLLDTGSVDIVLELEPNVSTAVANGAHIVYSMADKYPDFAITGVTVSGRTIQQRPDVVRRFVTALNQAEAAAHNNPSDVIAVAVKRFPDVPPSVAAAAVQRMLASGVFPAKATVSANGWAQAIGLRVESGDLKQASTGQGVVDNEFVPTN